MAWKWALLIGGITCFFQSTTTTGFQLASRAQRKSIRQHALPDVGDGAERDDDVSRIPPNFNPFTGSSGGGGGLGSNTAAASTSFSTSRNVVSLRKIQMQQVMGELLEATAAAGASSAAAEMQAVLAKHHNVLMAPFDDDADFLDDDPDSIYNKSSGMDQVERLEVYQQAMTKRIAEARNPAVRQVLQAMRDYVAAAAAADGNEPA